MSSWQLIFLQSRANNGTYEGDRLPVQSWRWPEETWFQKRRYDLQAGRRTSQKHRRGPLPQSAVRYFSERQGPMQDNGMSRRLEA